MTCNEFIIIHDIKSAQLIRKVVQSSSPLLVMSSIIQAHQFIKNWNAGNPSSKQNHSLIITDLHLSSTSRQVTESHSLSFPPILNLMLTQYEMTLHTKMKKNLNPKQIHFMTTIYSQKQAESVHDSSQVMS